MTSNDSFADSYDKRHHSGLAMLLVKVNLGRIKCFQGEHDVSQGGLFDTAVGGSTKRFREFMVFNRKRLCPEFLIIYDRIQKK